MITGISLANVLQFIQQVLGSLNWQQLIGLINGKTITIPVKPFVESFLGEQVTVSFVNGGVSIVVGKSPAAVQSVDAVGAAHVGETAAPAILGAAAANANAPTTIAEAPVAAVDSKSVAEASVATADETSAPLGVACANCGVEGALPGRTIGANCLALRNAAT